MSNNQGWLKLYRSLIDWEWYDDLLVFKLFIHLLLHANHQAKNWRGIAIQSGELITSYAELTHQLTGKQQTKIGVQQVRTAIGKLKSTGEITIKTTTKYSLIKINNWERYQDTNIPLNKQLTNNQQATNKQLTTNNNIKKDKNDKENILQPAVVKNFSQQIEPLIGQYAPSMITDFKLYWEETDVKGTPRWKKEKTWDIKRRLERWKRQQEKWDYEKEKNNLIKKMSI